MRTKWIITTGVLLAVIATAAFGQETEPLGAYPRYDGYAGYYGGPYGTYEGSAAAGMGTFARGVGEYNYYTAMALREREHARALAIQNHEIAVDNWHAQRAAHRERVRAEMLTPQQVARVVEAGRPARLTAADYQPVTGKLVWPVALLGEEYAARRAAVEKAFANRTSQDSGAGSAFYVNVRQQTEEMVSQLKEKLPELRPMEYIAARKFLTGVRYEALSPATPTALAMK